MGAEFVSRWVELDDLVTGLSPFLRVEQCFRARYRLVLLSLSRAGTGLRDVALLFEGRGPPVCQQLALTMSIEAKSFLGRCPFYDLQRRLLITASTNVDC